MLPNLNSSFSDKEGEEVEEDGDDAEMETEEQGAEDGTAEKVHEHTANIHYEGLAQHMG